LAKNIGAGRRGTKSTPCVLGNLIYEEIKLGNGTDLSERRVFIFLCLHHQNNRVENVSISLFALFQLSSPKTAFIDIKNTGGATVPSLPPPPLPQLTPVDEGM
jgi:hypothetical protein